MDETFFGDFLILVLMDLNSGYLLLEDISDVLAPTMADADPKLTEIFYSR